MTDIIFSFDTEDFTSSVAADAVVEEARLLNKNGIKGGFSVVGLLAKQLQSWKRQDVIAALKEHIIGNHSYGSFVAAGLECHSYKLIILHLLILST